MPRRRTNRGRRVLPPPWRRRSTMWLIAALFVLGIGALLGRCFPSDDGDGASTATPTAVATPRRTEPPATPAARELPDPGTPSLALPDIAPDPALLERAAVTNIVDGDTIDVEIDGTTERIRYYGSDTPERGEPCFSEATARNEALAGETVLLLPDARERDAFGRLLRYVFNEDGESIDALMIADGYARAWMEDGAYRDELVALEQTARSQNVGCLWEDG